MPAGITHHSSLIIHHSWFDMAYLWRTLPPPPNWWRLASLILGAEERGNRRATACHRPGWIRPKAGRASSPNPTANLVGSRKAGPDAAKRFAAFVIWPSFNISCCITELLR